MIIFGLDIAPFAVVLVFILFDVISGLVKAGATGTMSSKVMRNGLWHKATLILLESLAVCAALAVAYVPELPHEFSFVYIGVSGYIVLMEIISTLENISIANPEIANGRLYEFFGVNNRHDEALDDDDVFPYV